MKKVLSLAALVAIISADTIYLHPGWQLLGAVKDMNISEFNKTSITSVWAYDDENKTWLAYSPNPYLMNLIKKTPNVNVLNSISKYKGFWVLANNFASFNVDINNTESSNSNFSVDEILSILNTCIKSGNNNFESNDPNAVIYYESSDNNLTTLPNLISLEINNTQIGTLISSQQQGFFLYVAGNGDVYKGYFNNGKLIKVGKTNKFIGKCEISTFSDNNTDIPPVSENESTVSSDNNITYNEENTSYNSEESDITSSTTNDTTIVNGTDATNDINTSVEENECYDSNGNPIPCGISQINQKIQYLVPVTDVTNQDIAGKSYYLVVMDGDISDLKINFNDSGEGNFSLPWGDKYNVYINNGSLIFKDDMNQTYEYKILAENGDGIILGEIYNKPAPSIIGLINPNAVPSPQDMSQKIPYKVYDSFGNGYTIYDENGTIEYCDNIIGECVQYDQNFTITNGKLKIVTEDNENDFYNKDVKYLQTYYTIGNFDINHYDDDFTNFDTEYYDYNGINDMEINLTNISTWDQFLNETNWTLWGHKLYENNLTTDDGFKFEFSNNDKTLTINFSWGVEQFTLENGGLKEEWNSSGYEIAPLIQIVDNNMTNGTETAYRKWKVKSPLDRWKRK